MNECSRLDEMNNKYMADGDIKIIYHVNVQT